eukprot:GHVU01107357.1.p1 GENE.GHVU01107357.1~~GHVU01107357.1.p1  ORF type:complete len:279 (-),score=70.43 GHVU01107357.1:37-873(-)
MALLRKFLEYDETHCEFVFPDTRRQIEEALRGGPLQEGDYFLTRHSNRGLYQVVFHLPAPTDDPYGDAPPKLLQALRRVVQVAASNNVSVLTLPGLLLTSPTAESSLPFATLHKRLMAALRTVKGTLIEYCEAVGVQWESNALVNINLVLPTGTATAGGGGVPLGGSSSAAMGGVAAVGGGGGSHASSAGSSAVLGGGGGGGGAYYASSAASSSSSSLVGLSGTLTSANFPGARQQQLASSSSSSFPANSSIVAAAREYLLDSFPLVAQQAATTAFAR